MRLITIIVVFLLMGVFFIISEKGLNVASPKDLLILKNDYAGWLMNTAKNSATFVGQIIKMDWLPKSTENNQVVVDYSPNDTNNAEENVSK